MGTKGEIMRKRLGGSMLKRLSLSIGKIPMSFAWWGGEMAPEIQNAIDNNLNEFLRERHVSRSSSPVFCLSRLLQTLIQKGKKP